MVAVDVDQGSFMPVHWSFLLIMQQIINQIRWVIDLLALWPIFLKLNGEHQPIWWKFWLISTLMINTLHVQI